jgi:hypothetical protein
VPYLPSAAFYITLGRCYIARRTYTSIEIGAYLFDLGSVSHTTAYKRQDIVLLFSVERSLRSRGIRRRLDLRHRFLAQIIDTRCSHLISELSVLE